MVPATGDLTSKPATRGGYNRRARAGGCGGRCTRTRCPRAAHTPRRQQNTRRGGTSGRARPQEQCRAAEAVSGSPPRQPPIVNRRTGVAGILPPLRFFSFRSSSSFAAGCAGPPRSVPLALAAASNLRWAGGAARLSSGTDASARVLRAFLRAPALLSAPPRSVPSFRSRSLPRVHSPVSGFLGAAVARRHLRLAARPPMCGALLSLARSPSLGGVRCPRAQKKSVPTARDYRRGVVYTHGA